MSLVWWIWTYASSQSNVNSPGWWLWSRLIHHGLNETVYLNMLMCAADHGHPFVTTVYHLLFAISCSVNEIWHKANVIWNWFQELHNDFTVLQWPPQSPDLNPVRHLWDVVEREFRSETVQLSNLQTLHDDAIMSTWTRVAKECFQHLFWKEEDVLSSGGEGSL